MIPWTLFYLLLMTNFLLLIIALGIGILVVRFTK